MLQQKWKCALLQTEIIVMYIFILLSSFSMFALGFFPVKMLITKKYEVLNVQYFNK